MNKVTLDQAADFLKQHDNFVILTHRRPDGDTVGCAAALCTALRRLGKTVYINKNPDVTLRYASYYADFLPPLDYLPDTVVTVDTATENLFAMGDEVFAGKVDLAIDHHGSNEHYARRTLLMPERAACGEIIYELLPLMGLELDKTLANYIYLAVSTDTGCFRYNNTTGNTLRTAASAYDAGADAYYINKNMFSNKTFARLKVESMLISDVKLYDGGKTSVMVLTRDMMNETGATEDDVDDISGLPRGIKGVETGIFIRELGSNEVKISVRTAGLVNASSVCEKIGGGGHPGAAGASLMMGVDEAIETVLNALGETMDA